MEFSFALNVIHPNSILFLTDSFIHSNVTSVFIFGVLFYNFKCDVIYLPFFTISNVTSRFVEALTNSGVSIFCVGLCWSLSGYVMYPVVLFSIFSISSFHCTKLMFLFLLVFILKAKQAYSYGLVKSKMIKILNIVIKGTRIII